MAVTTRAYFDAAMDVLATRGFSSLTIAALCNEVGLTSGSFYHHFGSWDRFVDALMRDWEQRETTDLIAGIRGLPEDAETRLEVIVDVALTVPHAAESAIRSWSYNNGVVAATQRRVDEARLAFLEEVLAELPHGTSSPRVLSALLVAAFVGLEQLGDAIDPLEFVAVLGELRDRFTGLGAPRPESTAI